ncbi:MAG: chorismate-binding protein [Deltaproteobacteria bacterium]|nr:chorismate-binding protein [Deltaproteobacteria bacterium]
MSDEAPAIASLRVDDLGLDPRTAFARLRTYTPGRAAFLLESLAPAAEGGRYSIVGYRVRSGEVLPPGVDAFAVQAQTFESRPEPESLAAALAEGVVGFVSSSVASVWSRVRLFDDEGPSGVFVAGATVVLFDHQERTVTIAGPAKGRVVERCLWEMQHGPDPAPLAPVAPGVLPGTVHADVGDEKLQARAARAKAFVSELDALSLARTFTSPRAGADAFDVYRALAESAADAASPHGYYIDFGESPVQARLEIFGVAGTALHRRLPGDAPRSLTEGLRAALPSRDLVGAPATEALRLLRQLEEASRQAWGGGVGFVAPGGTASFVLGDEIITAQHGSFWCTAGARLDASTDPLSVADETRRAVARRLAAIARAQGAGA